MATLTSFNKTNLVDDHVAADVNALIAAALRSEYKNVETLSATRTLLDVDTPIQVYECGAADRIVKAPTADAVNNHPFWIVNASAAARIISVYDNAGTVLLGMVPPGVANLFLPDGAGGYKPANNNLAGPVSISSVITPTQLAADTNNWAPTGLATATVIRFSTDASRNITGLTAPTLGLNSIKILINKGSFNGVLKDESASSTAANRFALDADLTISPDQAAILWYDNTSSRWSCIAKTSAGGGGSSMTFSAIAPTTANVTATVNTSHSADLSGLTANRNFIVPAGTAGDVIELNIKVGHASLFLIVIGNTSITINGGSAATEYCRLNTANRTIKLIATSATNWQVLDENPNLTQGDGWTEVRDAWAYASASTITIPTDGTLVYQKGIKIRFKQGGAYKYYIGKTIAATLLTVITNTDYVVANAAITDIAYSYVENPLNFPEWFNYSTTIANDTNTQPTVGNSTVVARYKVSGRTVKGFVSIVLGSTFAAGSGVRLSFTLPCAASANFPAGSMLGVGQILDTGVQVYTGMSYLKDANTIYIINAGPAAAAALSWTTLFAGVSTGDQWTCGFDYEMA